jgi:hypothetical protein
VRRRSFLKLIGLGSLGASLPWAGSVAASSRRSGSPGAATQSAAPGRRLYRGSRGGIYMSTNAGRSWKLHTYLGPEYDVSRASTDGAGGASVRVAYGSRSFTLSLAPDLRSWLTD